MRTLYNIVLVLLLILALWCMVDAIHRTISSYRGSQECCSLWPGGGFVPYKPPPDYRETVIEEG